MIKIAVLQLKLDQQKDNKEKCATWIRKAKENGVDIVCLPELYGSHYFCQSEDTNAFSLAEEKHGTSFHFFSALAKELNISIIVPFFEKRMLGVYHNSVITLNEKGEEIGFYRKTHIPDDPHYYEKYYFTPGDLGFQVIKSPTLCYGVLICWDQWFPEAARITTLLGATTLFYPTAIGWHPKEKKNEGEIQKNAWQTVMRGHAVANGCYVAAANRIGLEKYVPHSEGIEFWGNSFICGPQGEILAQASATEEEILTAEINLAHLENVRQNWPFFRDRRTDLYSSINNQSLLP